MICLKMQGTSDAERGFRKNEKIPLNIHSNTEKQDAPTTGKQCFQSPRTML